MDLVGLGPAVFERIVREYGAFLDQIGIRPACFIPVSGRERRQHRRPLAAACRGTTGPTVLEALDALPQRARAGGPAVPDAGPGRLQVHQAGRRPAHRRRDDRDRHAAGRRRGDLLPVGQEEPGEDASRPSTARSRLGRRPGRPSASRCTEQIYVARGELATLATEPRPQVTTRLRVSLFWLGKRADGQAEGLPPQARHRPGDRRGSRRSCASWMPRLSTPPSSRTGSSATTWPSACSSSTAPSPSTWRRTIAATSRFVIVDDYEIRGGGIVREALPDRQTSVRDKVLLRNYKWEPSIIQPERRAEKYSQKAALILITGEHEADRKGLAKALEGKLFEDGQVVYFLGIGNVLYGVDADIERKPENRLEHMRRLAEVANLMLDAGMILIVTAAELTQDDLEVIKTAVQPDWIETIWAGDTITTDLAVRPPAPRRRRPRGGGPAQGAPAGQGRSSSAHGERPSFASAVIDLAREAGRATMSVLRRARGRGRAREGRPEPGHRSRTRWRTASWSTGSTGSIRRLRSSRRRRPPRTSRPAGAGAGSGWWIRSTAPRSSSSGAASSRSTSALIEEGEPVFGVVLAPALDLLYWAGQGRGGLAGGEGWRAGAHLLHRARARHAAHGGREPVASVAGAGGVSQDDPGGAAGQGRELAQVLLGRRGQGRHLSRASARPWNGTWRPAIASIASPGGDGERPSPLIYNKPDLRNPSFVIGL